MTPAFGLYTHIRANRFRSGLLLGALFALVQLAVYGFCLIAESMAGDAYLQVLLTLAFERWLHVVPFTIVGTLIWIAIAYYFNVKIISRMTGAQPVTRRSHPQLYNLLENLCMSRGITMPSLQIIETDELNAFASGLNDEQYTITVTEGLLYALDDDELEAVLAHELTHIRNQDVRLMVVSVIIVGVLSFASEMAFRTFFMSSGRRSSSARNGSGGRLWAYAIALAIIALAVFLSTILKLALSRRREYLADAGAVELTKNPDAMISALRTIEGNSDVEALSSNMMEMCIGNPRSGLANMFSTHPSMDDRVDALIRYAAGREHQPGFKGARTPKTGAFPLQPSAASSASAGSNGTAGPIGTSGPWAGTDPVSASTLPAANWNATPAPAPVLKPAPMPTPMSVLQTPAGMLTTAAVLAGGTAQTPPSTPGTEKPVTDPAVSDAPVSGPWAGPADMTLKVFQPSQTREPVPQAKPGHVRVQPIEPVAGPPQPRRQFGRRQAKLLRPVTI